MERGVVSSDTGFRYVLFMQTTQRLTRVRRFPAFRVSDWGFLCGTKVRGQSWREGVYISKLIR